MTLFLIILIIAMFQGCALCDYDEGLIYEDDNDGHDDHDDHDDHEDDNGDD